MPEPTEEITANDFGQLRAWLAINKFKQAEIDAAIGATPNDRTRAEIVADLVAWLRTETGVT